MGDFDLDFVRKLLLRRRSTTAPPATSTSELDRIPELLDRIGNRDLLRWLRLNTDARGSGNPPTPNAPQPPPAPTNDALAPDSPTNDAPTPDAPTNHAPTPDAAAKDLELEPPTKPPTPAPVNPSVVTASDLRAPSSFGLGNPLTNYRLSAADYSFVGRGVGALVDRIPNRLLALGANAALGYPMFRLRQYLHEGGHFRADAFYGGNPSIDFPLFGRPSTSPGIVLTGAERAVAAGAGMTQSQFNSMQMASDWARNEYARPFEAISLLLASTDVWTYSLARGIATSGGSLDDPVSYIATLDTLHAAGTLPHTMSQKELLALSLSAWALSGSTISSVHGLVSRTLVRDDRRLPLMSARIGKFRFTLPDFPVLLGGAGPIVGAQSTLFPCPNLPIETHLNVQPLDFAVAAGAQAFDLRIPWTDRARWVRDWRLNPFVDASASREGRGVRFGTDLVIPIGPLIFTGTVAHNTDNYLLNDVTSTKGFTAFGRLGFRSW